ncbi:Adenylate cyclase [hydrothermal vent metagenome]|uniref:Adenylate cyclase n=1 Tax=hydrothermal vent metagenome TaxID=652676 RepID=A0A3B0ZLK1_9ZZZZ
MLLTNNESKTFEKTKGQQKGPLQEDIKSLPKSVQLLLRLFGKILPSHIPVAIKLAISIGIMLTIVMTLFAAVIIPNMTKEMSNQITQSGSAQVLSLSKLVSELMIRAQPTETNPDSKTDSLEKQNLMLTLKVMTAQMATNPGILGAVIYSADHKLLSSEGISPFNSNAPYAKNYIKFLDNNLRILEWHWKKSPHGDLSAITFISPIKLQNTIVGHALVTFNHSMLDRAIFNIVQFIIIATLFMILLGIVLSYILGRRLTRPLYNLIEASREIGLGNYSYRLPERRNDEIGYLMSSFNQMAYGLYQKEQVEVAFSRHVSPTIAKEIIANMDEHSISTRSVHASVLFVDIVGYTAMSEALPPESVAQMLNEFYTGICKISKPYKGTIDKFMGDCAMVVFGIPEDDENHVFNSIACALCFQMLMNQQNKIRVHKGKPPIHFRIGVNTGDMIAGNMGSSDRIQYTVVGDSVNLASRLCAVAPTDSIIITDDTYNLAGLRNKINALNHERMRIRGISNPVNTYLVQDLQDPFHTTLVQNAAQVLHEMEALAKEKIEEK